MSNKDRIAYTDAVLCLQSKPSNAAPGLVPGARSRFDDFLAVHINQTFLIHFNVRSPKQVVPIQNFGILTETGETPPLAPLFHMDL